MFTRYFLLSLLLILPIKIIAQVPLAGHENSNHNPLPFGERVNIPSKFLNKDGIFDVYLPKVFKQDSDTTKYPLVITMDGWVLSQTVSGISSHLMNTAALPNSVVVALHTDVWSMLPKSYVHSTDKWPAESTSKLALAFKNNPPNAAEPFWHFLEKELIPFMENNFRTNNYRIFIGMSPTALMGLHTIGNAQRP